MLNSVWQLNITSYNLLPFLQSFAQSLTPSLVACPYFSSCTAHPRPHLSSGCCHPQYPKSGRWCCHCPACQWGHSWWTPLAWWSSSAGRVTCSTPNSRAGVPTAGLQGTRSLRNFYQRCPDSSREVQRPQPSSQHFLPAAVFCFFSLYFSLFSRNGFVSFKTAIVG